MMVKLKAALKRGADAIFNAYVYAVRLIIGRYWTRRCYGQGVVPAVMIGAMILSFVSVLTLNQAQASPRFTGTYLLQTCESKEGGQEIVEGGHAVCQSYIAGIIDLHNMMKTISDDFPSADFCVPFDATLYEVHGVVLEYLRANNQHDNFIAAPAVVTALLQEYPCK